MAAGDPEPAREAAQQRALVARFGDVSTAEQREGSYTERRGTLDDIDYMTDEEEGSLHDASGSDAPRGELQAGRWASSIDSCC